MAQRTLAHSLRPKKFSQVIGQMRKRVGVQREDRHLDHFRIRLRELEWEFVRCIRRWTKQLPHFFEGAMAISYVRP